MYLSVRPSVYSPSLPIYLPVYLSIHLPTYLGLSTCLSLLGYRALCICPQSLRLLICCGATREVSEGSCWCTRTAICSSTGRPRVASLPQRGRDSACGVATKPLQGPVVHGSSRPHALLTAAHRVDFVDEDYRRPPVSRHSEERPDQSERTKKEATRQNGTEAALYRSPRGVPGREQ